MPWLSGGSHALLCWAEGTASSSSEVSVCLKRHELSKTSGQLERAWEGEADLVIALLADEAHEGRGDLQPNAAGRHALARLVEQQLRDGARVARAQLFEHHDLVQPVQQLRPEVRLRATQAENDAQSSRPSEQSLIAPCLDTLRHPDMHSEGGTKQV